MVVISRSRRNRYAKPIKCSLFKRVLSARAGSLAQIDLTSNRIIRSNNSPIANSIDISIVRLVSNILKNSDRTPKWNCHSNCMTIHETF